MIYLSDLQNKETNSTPFVSLKHSGKPGRPSKEINSNWLCSSLSPGCNLSITALTKAIGIHHNTLSKKIHGLGIVQRWSEISDQELDQLVSYFKINWPNSGLQYIQGFLRSHDLHIQREQVRLSYAQVNPIGIFLRHN